MTCTKPYVTHSWLVSKEQCGTHARWGEARERATVVSEKELKQKEDDAPPHVGWRHRKRHCASWHSTLEKPIVSSLLPELQPAFATRHVSSRGRTTTVVAPQDQCASIRLLLHSIAPSKPRHVPPRSPPPCDVHVSAQQLADSCCCMQVIAASSAMGEETRSRTRAGKHATLGWFSPPHFSWDVARCGHPLRLRRRRSVSLSRVVSSVAAPCGASERRACIATGDARATRAVGGSRRRSRAGPFARAAVVFFSCSFPVRSPVVVLVSRLLFGRRSVRSEGAGGDGGRVRDARGAVRRRGWFSPPQSSRAVCARRGGLVLLLFSRPVVVLVLVSRLLYGRRSVWSEGAGGGGRRGTRARRARLACVAVGGSRRRSRAGPFARAAVVLFSCSSPVRSSSSSSSRAFSTAAAPRGARARGAGGDGGCARDARRGWFSPPQSSRAVRARRGGLFFSCSSPVRSPVVVLVLVSRLLYGRRSTRSEGAAGGDGGRARDARGARASPWVVLAAAVEQGRSRAPRWSSSLALLPSGRRSSSSSSSRAFSTAAAPCEARARGAGGDGGRARDARGSRASPWVVLDIAVEQGRSRAPRWSLLLLLFSRPVAGRRPRLTSSLRPPLHAERGRARGARRGQARDARGARASPWVVLAAAVEQGRSRAPRWSLLLLLFSRPVAGRRPRPRLAPSLRPPLRAERGRGGRGATGDARATRAVGGSRRRSRAGPFARAAVVSSSLALLPSGRRSSSSSRAFSTAAAPCGARARGATGDARATRAARVRRRGWFSPPQSSRAVRARRGGLFFSCSSPVPSVAPRARRSFAPPAGRRGARATRAGARTRAECGATGAACGESERGAP